jgi:hypothetical protein
MSIKFLRENVGRIWMVDLTPDELVSVLCYLNPYRETILEFKDVGFGREIARIELSLPIGTVQRVRWNLTVRLLNWLLRKGSEAADRRREVDHLIKQYEIDEQQFIRMNERVAKDADNREE